MAEVEIFKIEVDKENAARKLALVRKELAEATKTRKELNKQIADGQKLTQQEIRELAKAEKQISKNRAEQRELVKQISAENNSLQQLRNELARLTRARNNQETQTESGRESFARLTDQIKEYSDQIKEAEEAGGDFRRSVGNYQRAFEGVPSVAGKVSTSFKAVGTALKAIPFLFVIELVKEIIGFFLENAEVAELLADAFAAVSNVLGVVRDKAVEFVKAFININKAIIDFISGEKSLEEASAAVSKEIDGVVDSVSNLGSELQGAAVDAFNASKALRQVEEDTARLAITTNRTQRAIEEQLTVLANQTATLEERKQAGQEASRLIQEQLNKEIELEKRRLEATLLANKATTNSLEDTIKELEIAARIEELEAQKVARQKEVLGQISGIEKQVRAEQLKTVNEVRSANLQLQNFRNQIIAEDTENAKKRADALIEIEKNRLAIALQDETLYQDQRLLLELQTDRAIQKIRQEQLEQQRKDQQAINEFVKEARIANFENLVEVEEEKQGFINQNFQSELKLFTERSIKEAEQTERIREEAATREKIAKIQAEQEINAVQTALSVTAGLLAENTIAYKVAKSAEAAISTFAAINKTFAEPGLTFPANVITAAAIGAQGFANIAQINAAAGGGEFVTKGPTMLLVGDNPTGAERISVKPINSMGKTRVNRNSNMVAMAGGGTLMTGSADRSSIQANSANFGFDMSSFMQALQGVNLSVGVKEINTVNDRVKAKENISRLGS